MQRYFVPPEQWEDAGKTITITGDDVHHIARVMRCEPGDIFICSDGTGRDAEVMLTSVSQEKAVCKILHVITGTNEPFIDVTLGQALLKGEKMDWLVQKATEIGVRSIIPFTSSRTIVRLDGKKEDKRLQRWGKIAKEAAEQAHRSRIPVIENVLAWRELLSQSEKYDLAVIAYEQETGSLYAALQRLMVLEQYISQSPSVLLVIGPEGGFSPIEVEQAQAAGFVRVGLGRRTLRAETAGLVGLSAIFYHVEQVGRR